ncbi:polyphenol oxidase, chloroplastic-like [Chenopodium quinoa]|uniref:Tyrosinase copper-binding domain-containing protein n=1 Tax=Chenopodium quinoa TaxID=63459 RepID=A0A803LPT1_CHEQI|nr:polyphenol oxidase, chloroplastic-like [Chenopodium quinoa]
MSSLYSPPTTTTTISGATELSHHHVYPKTSQLSISRSLGRRPSPKISCKVAKNDDQNPKTTHNEGKANMFDRRNMLIGIGGLYGAATTLGGAPSTLAAPVQTPNPNACGPADLPSNAQGLNCCPPRTTSIVDFVLPTPPSTLRVRQPAHLVDDEFKEKFTRAMSLMKALPSTDPRSFSQQANVHCAYCNGGYSQVGFPNMDLQVHNSWLFYPFHRWYLYFYERILGNLIDDPTFAIPFWNWDTQAGMTMPTMYTDPNSPLYDPIRDRGHQPPKVLDLNYDGIDSNDLPDQSMIANNLTVMYRQMVNNSRTARLFLGAPYRAGSFPNPGGGSVENIPHGTVHVWTGDRNRQNFENMGNFYSAARDPLFYAHHANMDRMWSVWKTLGGNRRDYTDSDWLNASFIFYDENAQAIRVRVRDCVDTTKLGYNYQDVDLPWINAQPTASSTSRVRSVTSSTPQTAHAMESTSKSNKVVNFPKPLNKSLRTNVTRPKKSRSKRDKDRDEEVLVIEVDVKKHDEYVKFDVYINDEDVVPSKKMQVKAEYAGSFVNVPHRHTHGNNKGNHDLETTFRVGLTQLIEQLGADDDEGVTVNLVLRAGSKGNVVIKSMKIEIA